MMSRPSATGEEDAGLSDEQAERAYEEEYLSRTLSAAREQLDDAKAFLDKKRSEMKETKKEIYENTGRSIGNLSDAENFDALIELSQSISQVDHIVDDYEEAGRRIRRLEDMIASPYFARIDFRFEDEDEAEMVYIGRTSLKAGEPQEIYVYDWRSPIAGVFYRFMTGPAFYDAPGGRISGELERKRQYEIQNSRLCYFFDADVNVSDAILRRMLSENASPQMRSIVETIQREQDIVIRNMENDLLMIQGAAGSGKTSVALHRAAYLMYEGMKNRLAANNILILSPNTAFEEYIAGVLPELGEENVVSRVFDDLTGAVLKQKRVESCGEFLEQTLSGTDDGEFRKRSIRFKTSETFLQILNQFADDIPLYWMDFKDVYFEGRRVAAKETLKKRALQDPQIPLAARLERLAGWIWDGVLEENKHADKEKLFSLLQELQILKKPDIYRLYQILWDQAMYFQLDSLEGEAADIRERTLADLETDRVGYDDAIAMLYLHLKIYGSRDYQQIRQVIIDEAQDYHPLQYEIFRLLFPNARYTLLGDVNQTLCRQEDMSFYGRVSRILQKRSSSLVALKKSFRCTNQILRFSLRFIGSGEEIASFNRDGDEVTVRACPTRGEYLEQILREVGAAQERGYGTICLLCKNEAECGELYADLGPRLTITQVRGGADKLRGVVMVPSYLAKGLEFDAVILCGADARNYKSEDDRKLLYVECTRALHRLSVLCEGEMTAFVSGAR